MEVIGSDGGHVGRVDHVMGEEIELSKLDLGAGLKHHLIPMSWVDHIEKDKVCLNIPAAPPTRASPPSACPQGWPWVVKANMEAPAGEAMRGRACGTADENAAARF